MEPECSLPCSQKLATYPLLSRTNPFYNLPSYFFKINFNTVYFLISMIKSRMMRWSGHVTRMGEKISVYRILVEKPEGRRPLGRPRRRWVNNIKKSILREIGWGSMVD
jgi:hypothetical protein